MNTLGMQPECGEKAPSRWLHGRFCEPQRDCASGWVDSDSDDSLWQSVEICSRPLSEFDAGPLKPTLSVHFVFGAKLANDVHLSTQKKLPTGEPRIV